MTTKTFSILTFFMLALVPFDNFAQPKNYKIRHYTTDDGLPQNSITTIGFDKSGYCWLGTEMGLVRYDGHSFKVFNSFDLPGLRSDRIKFACFDSARNLYMQNELLQRVIIPNSNKVNSRMPVVPQLLDTLSPVCLTNRLVIQNPFLYKWIKGKDEIIPLFNSTKDDAYVISNGNVYYAEKDNIRKLHAIRNRDSVRYVAAGGIFLLFDKGITKAWKNGVLQPGIKDIAGPIQQNKEYKAGRATWHGDSYMYAGKNLYEIFIQDGILTSKLLLEDLDIMSINAIYYHAASRSYYIGSLFNGLYIVSLSNFHFLQPPAETKDDGFYSQVLTRDSAIICQRTVYHNGQAVSTLPIPWLVGLSLFLTTNQRLYYGETRQLFCYDLSSGSNKLIAEMDSRPTSIYQDKMDSNVVILSSYHAIYKMINNRFQVIRHMPFSTAINRSIQLGEDSFLVATASGLKWYDLKHDRVYRSVLDSIYVRAVHVEPNGRVWIGTYNRGSYLYEGNTLYAIPDKGYEALRTIHSFMEDSHGNFWLPTNNGLFTIKKETLRQYAKKERDDIFYYKYAVSDNLPTNEFNGGCTPNYLWLKDSLLSIPSLVGLVQFYPDKMEPLLPDNGIYIDEIRLNDSVVQLAGEQHLTIGPNYERLALIISSPYFGSWDNRKFVYKIEGIDNSWHELPADGKIELTGAAAGAYQFLVRKVTGDIADQTNYLQFSLTIEPWFYNTWWFHGIVVAAAVILLLMLAKIRIRHLKQRNLRLESIIQDRTSDLNQTVNQLKSSEQALKESNLVKDSVITMVLHDLRSPIRFLNTVSQHLAKKDAAMTVEERSRTFTLLKSGTESLNNFTEQFFAWAVSQQQTFKIFEETFSLQLLLAELKELYDAIALTNDNKLIIGPAEIKVHTDRNILSAVIRNLLDNANKNTKNGVIEISAVSRQYSTMIMVADNGRGLSEQEIEVYYAADKAPGMNGNGSIIVISLLQKIGGKLTIQSEKFSRTVFSIELFHHQ